MDNMKPCDNNPYTSLCTDSNCRIAKRCCSLKHSLLFCFPLPFYKEKERFPSTWDSWATVLSLEFALRRHQIISPSGLSCCINRAYMSQGARNLHVKHLHWELAHFNRECHTTGSAGAQLGWGRGDQIQKSHDSALPQLPEVACVTGLPLASSFLSLERQSS